MDMKKIAFVLIFAAATLSAVMAAGHEPAGGATTAVPAKGAGGAATAAAPVPDSAATGATASGVPAPAPGPSNGAADLGSLLGATLISLLAYYMQF